MILQCIVWRTTDPVWTQSDSLVYPSVTDTAFAGDWGGTDFTSCKTQQKDLTATAVFRLVSREVRYAYEPVDGKSEWKVPLVESSHE